MKIKGGSLDMPTYAATCWKRVHGMSEGQRRRRLVLHP